MISMANYLERVASSAGRRAAIAKPPVSGPPVLPAGRDLSIGPEASFASDEEQFLETLETSAPARTEERSAIAANPKPQAAEEPKTRHDSTVAPPLEPRPRPTQERLSSDSPFTVHVPRTLRPITTPNIPTPPVDERARVRASTTVAPEESTTSDEPAPIVHPANTDLAIASMPAKPRVADPDHAPVPRPVHTEATLPGTAAIPRVDGPPRYSAEPSPPTALPVHLPPAAGNTTRQDQSRVHIGSLEVLVNNHPQITPVRPAPAPSRTERLNLEKRYLDRFRLRH